MDWIWLFFVLFSLVASLLEKSAKLKRENPAPPAPGSPYPPGEGRFFRDEPEKKKTPARPGLGERPGLGQRPQPKVRIPTVKRPMEAMSLDDEYLMPAFWEEETTAGPGGAGDSDEVWGTQRDDPGATRDKPFPVERSREEEPLPGEGWKKPETFLSALVLAHVLKRPDFRTLPWQRRV